MRGKQTKGGGMAQFPKYATDCKTTILMYLLPGIAATQFQPHFVRIVVQSDSKQLLLARGFHITVLNNLLSAINADDTIYSIIIISRSYLYKQHFG